MKGRWVFRGLKIIAFIALAVAISGFVVTQLWNYVMPALFGLHMITFWQAVALVILGKLLFGGFRPRGGMYWRGRMMKRWAEMTPEQREKFREGMRGACGPFRDATPEHKT